MSEEILTKLAVLESQIRSAKDNQNKIVDNLPVLYSRIEEISKEIFILSGRVETCMATHNLKNQQQSDDIKKLQESAEIKAIKEDIKTLQDAKDETKVFIGNVKILYPISLIILNVILWAISKFYT